MKSINNLFDTPFTWQNREHFLKLLPHTSQMRFALFCGLQVKHLLTNEQSLKALEVTQAFLEGKATKEDCKAANAAAADAAAAYVAAYAAARAAAHAARAAAHAAYAAAHAARAAAHAAYAAARATAYAAARATASADAAYAAAAAAAAYAANAAAYAAADAAADAAANAAEQIKQEQMNFLRELILENLSEEERDCWLLVASF